MKSYLPHIRRSLSWQLCLGILLFVLTIFIISHGYLFMRSRQLVEQEAIERSTRSLESSVLRVRTYLDEVETASKNIKWLVLRNLRTDSLLNYTNRIVALNPNINGCSITLEPDVLPGVGAFSAYSVRDGDVIETVIEGDYDYYKKIWYEKPKMLSMSCWVDPYSDYNPGTLSSAVIIASYGEPLMFNDGRLLGVLSTDLALSTLSDIISAEKPYPNSYCTMLGVDGRFLVHPDHTKLVRESIFSISNKVDIEKLGHEMVDGKKGHMEVKVDGKPCLVFYQPVMGTDWSVALVCPKSDIFGRYNKQMYIVVPILAIGLLLMVLFCRLIIIRFIRPLKTLALQTRHVAKGHFDERLTPTERVDVLGRLQNTFIKMQDAISEHIRHIQQVNSEVETRNAQQAEANKLVEEANQRKTDFIQSMTQQVRTPLNLIVGFAQLLGDEKAELSDEDKNNYIEAMWQNSITVKRMSHMLFDVSYLDDRRVLDCTRELLVNDAAREAMQISSDKFTQGPPIELITKVPDDKTFHSNRLYLYRLLRELLFNAKKFAHKGVIHFVVDCVPGKVRFVIEDQGDGIAEADREKVFEPFVKLDKFSEGLGLGLGLSRKIAKGLGGTLIFDTTYTDGARFIIELPDV